MTNDVTRWCSMRRAHLQPPAAAVQLLPRSSVYRVEDLRIVEAVMICQQEDPARQEIFVQERMMEIKPQKQPVEAQKS